MGMLRAVVTDAGGRIITCFDNGGKFAACNSGENVEVSDGTGDEVEVIPTRSQPFARVHGTRPPWLAVTELKKDAARL